MTNLGFGCMRFPTIAGDPANIDIEQLKVMVDEFLTAGFNYFDTSFVYHNGKSEDAVKQCLTSRYPRDKYVLTTKLPTFIINEEKQVSDIFNKQLENCGVDYFDYFLLHNLNIIRYENEVKRCRMFEQLKEFKAAGKIKHIGFSFHDSADVLNKILTEQPEVDAVQIVVNYYDWDARYIQSRKCYETIRKHGRKVLIMEPVKGGMLAKAPAQAEKLFKNAAPDISVASWAIRFAANLDGVIAVISGMSNLEQVKDNVATIKAAKPLTAEDEKILREVVKIYRESGPVGKSDYSAYENISSKGITAAEILETYNSAMIQSVPTFSAEENYYSTEKAKRKIKADEIIMPKKAVTADGEDVSEILTKAEKFLTDTMFFKYEV